MRVSLSLTLCQSAQAAALQEQVTTLTAAVAKAESETLEKAGLLQRARDKISTLQAELAALQAEASIIASPGRSYHNASVASLGVGRPRAGSIGSSHAPPLSQAGSFAPPPPPPATAPPPTVYPPPPPPSQPPTPGSVSFYGQTSAAGSFHQPPPPPPSAGSAARKNFSP